MEFEDQMCELEEIIQKLESGEVKFDQVIKMYERGAQLCKNLSKRFDEAKGKVVVIREELMGILNEEPLKFE